MHNLNNGNSQCVCHQLNRVHSSTNNQLCLGTAVCGPHSCQHFGAAVDTMGRHHALSCKRSEGSTILSNQPYVCVNLTDVNYTLS